MRLPIRLRIAAYSSLLVALTILVFGIVLNQLAAPAAYGQLDQGLAKRAHDVAAGFQPQQMHGIADGAADVTRSPDPFIEVLAPGGLPIFSTGQLHGSPPPVPADLLSAADSGSRFRTYDIAAGRPVRVYVLHAARPDLPFGSLFVVSGQPVAAVEQSLNGLRVLILIVTALTLAGAFTASWFVAGRALRPLVAMAGTAEQIGATRDLSRRLPPTGPKDELGRLGESFNTMLARLEQAYRQLEAALEAQRRFVADASHELRTPLTTIRGNAGLLLRHSRMPSAERRAALADIDSESERMSRLADDLLTLARADAGQRPEHVPLDLEPLVDEVVRRARQVHPDWSFDLESRPVTVSASADALRQLLWILLDNAVKHTQPEGVLRVGLAATETGARLWVSDDGPGLPPGEEERIFERFYQADRARSGQGAGLGLSIARWLAGEHGGRIWAANNRERGATFTVELPLSETAHASLTSASQNPESLAPMAPTPAPPLTTNLASVAFVLLVLQAGFTLVTAVGAFFFSATMTHGAGALAVVTLLSAVLLLVLALGVLRRRQWARAAAAGVELLTIAWLALRLVIFTLATFTFLDLLVSLAMPAAVLAALLWPVRK